MEQTIRSVILTLDNIEVHGKKNLDRLLGSIQTLEQLLDELGRDNDGKENP